MAQPVEIDPVTALERATAGSLFVDVREQDEVVQAAYDVPGMVVLPLSELPDRFDELPKDRELIMACRSGGRSMRALQFLQGQGYEQVVNLAGGILRWQAEGHPLKG
jgi:rhodanese-related sulfurtransferase